MSDVIKAEVVVIGGGPGGYTAAFRAADLGKRVVLVEKQPRLGGVCLNVGCIPSKALLHVAEVINEAKGADHLGLTFSEPTIDLEKIIDYKNSVITKLTDGLAGLAKQRQVEIISGEASFSSSNTLSVATADGEQVVEFENCIVAVGSRVTQIPNIPYEDDRVWDSSDALKLKEIPKRLLVIGGGIIGLEMATVYDALGSSVTVVEFMSQVIPAADKDIVQPLQKKIKGAYENLYLKSKVTGVEATDAGLVVSFEGKKTPVQDTFDAVLVAVGRRPNGLLLNADAAGLAVTEQGFIEVNSKMETNVKGIYAIGDVVGQPMLAHKAVHEARVAAEVISGLPSTFNPITIPSVAYTSPEVAWMGLTEKEAKEKDISYEKGIFPWAASGRALSVDAAEGKTKALFCPDTKKLLGVSMVGKNVGELISGACMALNAGMTAHEIGSTIHPHPTLSETLGFAAEMFEGTITDLMPPRKR
ncbi:MAG: dihydrolipoyl dehydrogenase [Lentisphaeria bacterium]|nr:dihydrolipoyl dehydrogenase [Lentisphaeria bacterium]